MISITIDASQVTEVATILGANLDDLAPAFKLLGESVLEDARSRIVAQGEGEWPQMSPWTNIVAVALYEKGRDPRTLLQDTRGLIESLRPEGADNIFEVGPESAEFGSRYSSQRTGYGIARGQQLGSSRTFHVLQGSGFSDTGTPPREFLMFPENRLDDYDRIFSDHVGKGV